jgi:hypothetical protein
MTTPRIYWVQAGQDAAAAVPRVYSARIAGEPVVPVMAAPRVYSARLTANPVAVAPPAPTLLTADGTGGQTYLATWADNSAGQAGVELQIELNGSNNWVAAAGEPNPTSIGVESFAGSGASPASVYRVRLRAVRFGADPSDWVVSSPFGTDNTGAGDVQVTGLATVSAAVAAQGQVTGTVSASAAVSSPGATVAVAAQGQIIGAASASAGVSWPAASAAVAAIGLVQGTVSASAAVSTTPAPAPAPAVVGGAAKLARWAEKDPRESFDVSFSFPGPVSDVIMSVESYSPYGVSDTSPEQIFHGSFIVSGSTVTQRVRGGIDLVDYYVDVVATVGGQRLVQALVLPVREK